MSSIVRRARPWLGTLVEIRVDGLGESAGLRAVEEAFAEIALVHRLMSFHDPGSDVSRINRAAAIQPVAVDGRTCSVLQFADTISAASRGSFDITVAAQLVAWGALPRPGSEYAPDPAATWRDVELLAGQRVRARRPLWIDLGGIAKGYAVDRAIEILQACGATQCCVNAGGDLRVSGPNAERVHLRRGGRARILVPGVELADAAIATSAGLPVRGKPRAGFCGTHVHGTRRQPAGAHATVSVVAPRCMLADALTKVVLADAAASGAVLAQFAAHACVHDSRAGWRLLDRAA